MIHLLSVTKRPLSAGQTQYPFSLPLIQTLSELKFTAEVTFLVGENGSGKSTLLEALACAVGSITVGAEPVQTDPTLAPARQLAKQFKLAWRKRTHKGFFLRAEDFFSYTKKLAQMRAELEQDLRQVDEEYSGRSKLAVDLAKLPYRRELSELRQKYGAGLEQFSHGESFLAFFQARFVPGGLYLLDEPEAPLSPGRQLALISALKQMVAQEAQFIIATHSPILMAFPGAAIWSFEGEKIEGVAYEELEHVILMKSFLNNPAAFLQHL